MLGDLRAALAFCEESHDLSLAGRQGQTSTALGGRALGRLGLDDAVAACDSSQRFDEVGCAAGVDGHPLGA